MGMIAHNAPHITREDRAAVDRVLRSGQLAQGEQVRAFEQEMAERFGPKDGDACAVSSGSAAILLALKSLGICDGDIVGLPSYSCVALLQCVKAIGAYPQIWDCDDVGHAVPSWPWNQKPQAGLFVSTYGLPYRPPKDIGVKRVLCHAPALGAPIDWSFADVACFSFGATKPITAGGGGMLIGTRWLTDFARELRDYDGKRIYRDRFNWQMGDMQAALGRSQLKRLDRIMGARLEACYAYRDALIDCSHWYGHNGYRFVVECKAPSCQSNEQAFLQDLMAKRGIETRVLMQDWELLHRQVGRDAPYPVSERLAATHLSLPTHPGLSSRDVKKVAGVLREWAQ
jgi:perosamine synthetase